MKKENSAYKKAKEAYYAKNRVYFERYRKSKDLTYFQKRLLSVISNYSKDKWKENLDILKSMSLSQNNYMNGEYYFHYGYVCWKLAKLDECITNTSKSLEYYQKAKANNGIFNSSYNLSVYYFYKNNIKSSNDYLDIAKSVKYTKYEEAHIYKQDAYILFEMGQKQKAINTLEMSFALKDVLNSTEVAILETASAEVYFRNNQIDKAINILNQVKNNKTNDLGSWAYIQLKFIDIYKNKKALGRVPKIIQNDELYLCQWHIIEALQGGMIDYAKKLWEKLHTLNPQFYGRNFQIQSNWEKEGVFSKILQQLISSKEKNNRKVEIPTGSMAYKLYHILQTSISPRTKEDLIEEIWNVKYDPKYDNRFYQLVRKLKNNYQVKIKNSKSAYKLVS